MKPRGRSADTRRDEAIVERRRRFRAGLTAETAAAVVLRLKGYRILDRRCRTPLGEIDLVVVRGRRLAFVEVKRRLNAADAEAAVSPRQAERIRRAADLWLARHAAYQDRDIAFDIVHVLPRRWPRHLADAL